jgi:quinol monooxygenase YgiN
MAASVHVVARYLAKPGKEDEVMGLLTALVAPSRRELGCYQYDLLRNPVDPRDFCFVERWEDDQAVDQHSATAHVKTAGAQVESLVEVPPDVRRYEIL